MPERGRVRIVLVSLRDGLARLADVAPVEIVVLSEDTDWGLVGGDLRNAIEAESNRPQPPAPRDREELVEA
jgi:hypothetical protein